jgi:hypothetical protein
MAWYDTYFLRTCKPSVEEHLFKPGMRLLRSKKNYATFINHNNSVNTNPLTFWRCSKKDYAQNFMLNLFMRSEWQKSLVFASAISPPFCAPFSLFLPLFAPVSSTLSQRIVGLGSFQKYELAEMVSRWPEIFIYPSTRLGGVKWQTDRQTHTQTDRKWASIQAGHECPVSIPIRALSAHSEAEFKISPGRWQHVWLVAIVPP